MFNYLTLKKMFFSKGDIEVLDSRENKYLFNEIYIDEAKNKIVGIAAFIMAIIGTSLILVGIFKYREYAIGFSIAGVGFYAIAWAFNALRGRI